MSTTSMPVALSAEMKISLRAGVCRRTSPPTETRFRPLPRRMVPKAMAMRRTVSSVSSVGWMPRMSYSRKMERFISAFDDGVLGDDDYARVGDVEAFPVPVEIHAHLEAGRNLHPFLHDGPVDARPAAHVHVGEED